MAYKKKKNDVPGPRVPLKKIIKKKGAACVCRRPRCPATPASPQN